MRIFLMTDLEGVAGVLNFEDWCVTESRYYDTAKELLTREVNAAVEGFYAAGASIVLVVDGHGVGGINPVLLDKRVELMRGLGMGYPYLLDEGYDAIAWVGQHAKAGSEYAHLAHTQSFRYLDLSVNDISIGEFGQLAMCASELDVPAIFFAGDAAGCLEAQRLTPGIETVSVKRGTTATSGAELDARQYMSHNYGAIHRHPERACHLIREGAERALRLFGSRRPQVDPPLTAPYKRVAVFRATAELPQTMSVETHPDSVIELLNLPFDPHPVTS
ncbi:MAG TPA: M55 family metallopeptidase [Anaerolineae bacterium]|jgi:D-amino peptidase